MVYSNSIEEMKMAWEFYETKEDAALAGKPDGGYLVEYGIENSGTGQRKTQAFETLIEAQECLKNVKAQKIASYIAIYQTEIYGNKNYATFVEGV